MDHKNLIYFQNIRITNRRQAQWALEMQNIPFRLEYLKEKENTIADTLTRQKDMKENLEPQKIFLQIMSIEKTREQEYHPFMKIAEIKKQDDGQWKYRGKIIVRTENEKRQLLERNHDDSRTEHLDIKETLRKMAEIAF